MLQAERHYYFIHVYGFYKIILKEKNTGELEQLLGDDLTSLISIPSNKQGKILFKILNDSQEYRDRLFSGLLQLAFVPRGKDMQLPLVTLPRNPLVKVFFRNDTYIDWDKFMINISLPNGISASYWTYEDTVQDESHGYKIIFNIDGKSYSQIQEMGHLLPLKNRKVRIEVDDDPYLTDINNLPL